MRLGAQLVWLRSSGMHAIRSKLLLVLPLPTPALVAARPASAADAPSHSRRGVRRLRQLVGQLWSRRAADGRGERRAAVDGRVDRGHPKVRAWGARQLHSQPRGRGALQLSKRDGVRGERERGLHHTELQAHLPPRLVRHRGCERSRGTLAADRRDGPHTRARARTVATAAAATALCVRAM